MEVKCPKCGKTDRVEFWGGGTPASVGTPATEVEGFLEANLQRVCHHPVSVPSVQDGTYVRAPHLHIYQQSLISTTAIHHRRSAVIFGGKS
jgi:hypothetical protein